MRFAVLLTLAMATTSQAAAATPPLGAGYGAIDATRDTDPVTLANAFCTARIVDDMSTIAGHFAPKLELALAEVPATQVPWQSLPDRPSSCSVEVLNGFDDTVGVLVRVTYKASDHTWSDTLNLERTPDTWLINNVFYENGGNLRFRLFEN